MPKQKSLTRRTPRQTAAQLRGPASLASPEARTLASCRGCGSARVTSIEMTLTDGSIVNFASCHHCETRWWLQDGRVLSFEKVIAKTRKIA